MRYRPLGATGTAVSAVSLALTDAPNRRRAEDWRQLIYDALECGVNAFEVVGTNPAIVEGLGEALKSVERHLVFVGLRLGPTPQGRDFSANHLAMMTESTIARMGVEYLDLLQLDDPGEGELSGDAMATLKALRAAGRTRLVGVAGESPALDFYISSGGFNAIAIPYNLASGWTERHRLKAAAERDMAVLGYNFWPEAFHKPQAEPLASAVKRLFIKPKVTATGGAGGYDFLFDTPNWTAEDICLGFALTEPSIATVQIDTEAASHLARLAEITEKEMPNGVSSRIEMARFGNQKTG